MKKNKMWLWGGGIAAVSLFVGIAVGFMLLKLWQRPLNPALPTLVPTATQGVLATSTTDQSTEGSQGATAMPTKASTATPEPTATPQPMCGGPAAMNILAVGTNYGFYDLADVIRVVHVDFVNGEIYVVPLPRDLKIDLPPDATSYPSPQKINEGYFLGTPVWQSGAPEHGGAILLAQTLAYNFGITTDHYVVISGQGFRQMVDALGGVQVYLPSPVVDNVAAHGNFPAGNQVLDGYHAWMLARIRRDVGDLGRIERQTILLKALLRQIASPAILPKLPDLVKLYKNLVLTDLSPEQISQLICLLQKMDNPLEHIHFYSVPRELLNETGEIIYIGENKSTVPQDVLLWDERYKQWLHDALVGKAPK